MTDETPDKSEAPGSTASDAARTGEVSHLPKPQTHQGKPAQSATPDSGNGSAPNHSSAEEPPAAKPTMTERITAAVPASLRNPKPVVRTSPVVKASAGNAKGNIEGVKAVSRPVTAGEYARTTKPSPSTTAVIPAIRDDVRQPTGAAAVAAAASGRQASLKLVRVDPWSVTRVTFALTVALMIVAVVAVTILWIVLSFAGVWDQINSSVTTVLSDNTNSFDITQYLGLTRIVGLTLVLSAINVIITTAVATIGAYLYNLAAQLLGGVDITLAEED